MEEIINNFKYKQMNKKEEQVEEQEKVIPKKMDASSITKKRDTSFVDERKKQIELYGNYYPAGLSDQKLLEWILSENNKLQTYLGNLSVLESDTEAKIESDRQSKLAATLAGLSEAEKEQLKTMLG